MTTGLTAEQARVRAEAQARGQRAHRRHMWMLVLGRIAIYGLILVGSAIFVFPFLFMLSTSLKTLSQIYVWPIEMIPNPLTFANYIEGWTLLPTATFYLNTIFVTAVNIVGTLLSSTLVAYGFARLRFPGRNVLFVVLLATMMLPGQVTMIPLYVGFSKLGWVGTFKPLTVPSFFANPFNVFLLRQFLMTIPHELDDAAKIDGCGYIRTLVSIVLPLMLPAIGVVAIFTFTYTWNDFMGPLIYLRKIEQYTIAIGLRYFQQVTDRHMGRLMAMAIVALVPQVVVFFFAQKQMVQGVTLTGIKG